MEHVAGNYSYRESSGGKARTRGTETFEHGPVRSTRVSERGVVREGRPVGSPSAKDSKTDKPKRQRHLAGRGRFGRLYHYTSIEALHSILEGGSLWATHSEYLNDSQEGTYGGDLVSAATRSLIDELERDNPEPLRGKEKLLSFIDGLAKNASILTSDQYVSCFSRSADQLSRWRGYGREGYAIGFDFVTPSDSARAVGGDLEIEFREVEYNASSAEVRERVLDIVKAVRPNSTVGEAYEDLAGVGNALRSVRDLMLKYKNPAFAEEKEVRLAFFGDPTFYDPTAFGLVPRHLVKFDPKAIRSIAVGPGKNMELRCASIEHYISRKLRSLNGEKIEVVPSKVPYRG